MMTRPIISVQRFLQATHEIEIDLHGYHPSQIDVHGLIRQAWEVGSASIKFIHGHGRNRGKSPGFVNTNTGYLGLTIRRAIRNSQQLKPWARVSTLNCGDNGSTSLLLKPNPSPSRREIELPQPMYSRQRGRVRDVPFDSSV